MKWDRNVLGIVREDWWFLIIIAIVWFLGLTFTFWDFLFPQGRPHSFGAVNLLGAALVLIGLIIRTVARMTLGRFFPPSIMIQPNHRLITHGIYKRVRHPAYAGTISLSLGIPLAFNSILGFVIMLFLIPCILYRIPVEERMLIAKFGPEYLDYENRTMKLIPFLY